MPKPLASPPNSPMTAVPWFRQPISVLGVPPTTPPWFCVGSSWLKRHAPSISMMRTPSPCPPEHPGVTCIDSAGRGVEVDLTAGEVRRRWGSIDRRWRHLVERRLRRRLHVGSLNCLVLPRLFRNRAELLLGCLHGIIDRQIRCRRTVPQAWQPQ
jgi:hypothetical protein